MIEVLLIEDNNGDAYLVNELLNRHNPQEYKVTHVTRIEKAISILKDAHFDVVISDIALPDSQGTDSFKSLKSAAKNLPVIFFTGTHDESLSVEAIRRGAQDYLLKNNLTTDILTRSIRYAIERKQFQLAAEKERARARKLRLEKSMFKRQSEQLMQLNKAKDDFVSLASHQLRTPATGVKQYLGMAIEGFGGNVSDTVMQYLKAANSSNERQLKVIDDLLKAAHLDAGKINLIYARCDIVSLIKDIIADLANTFKKRSQTMKFTHDDEQLWLEIDCDTMRIALENIVDNASKYSNSGKQVTVKVSQKGQLVKIVVKDAGVGIADEDVDKVFDKFARVTNPLSKDVGGSGLGLYWSKSIIEMHQGTVGLDSKLGEGSTFTITLPVAV